MELKTGSATKDAMLRYVIPTSLMRLHQDWTNVDLTEALGKLGDEKAIRFFVSTLMYCRDVEMAMLNITETGCGSYAYKQSSLT